MTNRSAHTINLHTTYRVTGQDGTDYGKHEALDPDHARAMAASHMDADERAELDAVEID